MSRTVTLLVIAGGVFAACAAGQNQNQLAPRGSQLKAVTIKHPNFRETMDKTLSADVAKEADELVGRMMAKVMAKASNCESGVTAQDKDFGETKVSETVLDSTYTFKKGCDYVVSLVYFDSASQTVMLASDGKTINLTKSELEKSKPVAKVTLKVSLAARKFWSQAPLLETGSDTDATIEPVIPSNSSDTGESGFDLAVPACLSKTVVSAAAGTSCMNDFRLYLSTFASKYSQRGWFAGYQSSLAGLQQLTEPTNDAASKASFCQINVSNAAALAKLPAAITGTSAEEEDFACKLASAVAMQYSVIQDTTLKLVGCK